MNDLQLLEAVERYLRNEMGEEERQYFEELRKSSPEIDQLVVEHTMFLGQVNNFSNWKEFKNSLHEVHGQLTDDGTIKAEAPKAIVVELWRKYKRVMGVAASIAGITTLLIAGSVSYYTSKKNQKQLEELSRKVSKEMDQKTKGVLIELNKRTPKIPETVKKISGGSGFLIDGKGYIVTNAHVIKSSVVVQNTRGQEFRAKVILLNEMSDIAILKIEDEDFKPLGNLPYNIRKSAVDLGEPLFTLGFPRNEIVYNEGYMSAKTGFNGDTMTCQVGVPANPGNSGGPVFNKNGEIIGIINTRQSQADGVVFAITAKNIYRALEELKKDTSYAHVKLPTAASLKGMERIQQIKKIEDCVFMVKSY